MVLQHNEQLYSPPSEKETKLNSSLYNTTQQNEKHRQTRAYNLHPAYQITSIINSE